ncbi:MAG: C40 family peptidase [Actinobacteria bacterium]|nr:C40 family peptidase [Actinomycetota bacterium]
MPFAPGVARSAARRSPIAALFIAALATLAATLLVAAPAASARALPGGVSAQSGLEAEIPESTEPPVASEPGTGEAEYVPGTAGKARLVNGRAIAPANAPLVVKRVIAAANRIRTTPYVWGGGHGSWVSYGYDCSGSVSYALHGGRLLNTPLTSGSLEAFGEAGPGRWITIYANASHTYMVVAGLRFDTAGDTSGTGPRWHPSTAAAATGRYVVRHPVGY